MNPAEWLVRTSLRAPNSPAILHGTKLWACYEEFAARAAYMAAALQKLGVKPGDRIGLFTTNRPEYLIILHGIWWLGAVPVPINNKLHCKETAWILENSEASMAFVSEDIGAELRAIETCPLHFVDGPEFCQFSQEAPWPQRHPTGSDDMIWLFYTSGTTGRPKGVMMPSRALMTMSLSYPLDVDPVNRDDVHLYAAPMSHGAGIYNFIFTMAGAKHLVPESGGFEAKEILQLGRDIGNIHSFFAPTMVRRLIDEAKAEKSHGEGLKSIIYGGGPMYLADILEGVEVMGPRFVQVYGQGEAPMAVTSLKRHEVADRGHPRWRERLASIGAVQSPITVTMRDGQNNEVPRGEMGEICVKGPLVMLGYWRNDEATNKAIRDGWLFTGDVGFMDDDGYITLKDRSKDMIISGGTNIYPREVEECLLLLDHVHEVAVVGEPDPEWGENVVAFVRLHSGHETNPKELDTHCVNHIARFKRPKRYIFVTDLPKNNYGKILKTELRKQLGTSS